VSAGTVPWNKGTHAFDRGWQAGYLAGVSERLGPRLRALIGVGLLVALVVVVRRRDRHPVVRFLAAELVVVVGAVVVAALPVELVVGAVLYRRHRRRLAELGAPAPLDEPFGDS
jgi:hypothetical protein